jgi:prepilin-type N-terminal cleavage/methylation domain-containing protein
MIRRGYSLVEVLVAVGVLAVLTGLLLAAVQKARLMARQADNRNHVRQMMIAVHNYATAADGRVPGDDKHPSFMQWLVLGVDGGSPDGGSDHDSFIDVWTVPLNYTRVSGPESPQTPIGLYVNPCDPSWWHYTSGGRPVVGDCGYGANALAFAPRSRLDASFPDGTSNTLAVAERYARCRDEGHPIHTNVVWSQTHARTGQGPSISPRTPTFADAFYDDTRPAVRDGRTVANRPGRPFQVAPPPPDCDPFVPQATTPSGLVVGLMDGSVRTVGGGVNPDLFWAAVTPAGGDIGSLDD